MPFLVALVASAVLHAAAITMPGWDLPGSADAEPAAIDAELVPQKPAPVAVAAPAKRPSKPAPVRKAPRIEPAAEVPVAAAPVATAPVVSPIAPTVAEAPVAAPEPVVTAPPAPPWPRAGRMRYLVTWGDGGFIIGETVHEWRIDEARYSIRSVATPRGLAALRGKTRSQSSEGEVTASGLRPSEFRDQREGREAESAVFDWSAGKVAFSGGRGESRIADGTQDMVSVFYQLAWLAPRADIDMAVATASRLGRWKFEWLGEERLEAAGATLSTLHLRTRADGDITEVWLAPAHGGLPVKIRHVDRKGETFEQTADTLEIQG